MLKLSDCFEHEGMLCSSRAKVCRVRHHEFLIGRDDYIMIPTFRFSLSPELSLQIIWVAVVHFPSNNNTL